MSGNDELSISVFPYSAPKHDYKLTGRLQLQLGNLPPFMGPIRRTWADGKHQRIEDCIGDFIVGLTVAAAAIKRTGRRPRKDTVNGKRNGNEKKRSTASRRSASEKLNLSPNLSDTGKKRHGFVNSLEPLRKKRHSRIFRTTREMTFNRWLIGPRSTPTRWIRCPIFPTPSRSSYGPRASIGGWSELILTGRANRGVVFKLR